MIQWYPGHMAKAIREIEEKLKLVDLVIVLLDSRIPKSSFNPLLCKLINNKMVLYILTKKDMADSNLTNEWLRYYQKNNITNAIAINSKDSKIKNLVTMTIEKMLQEKRLNDAKKGLKPRSIRTMVVGIPNVGKSTFINMMVNKKVTNVGDKPGVTKVQQWIRINKNLELLDTPGVLWPKFEDQKIGYNLAIIGSIKDEILKIEDIVTYALDYIKENYQNNLISRYNLTEADLTLDSFSILLKLGKEKKFYLTNGDIDLNRISTLILRDIRQLSLGAITFEKPNE